MATINEALHAAVKLHQDGRLADAERIYREILKVAPRTADAWHLLGLVHHSRGDWTTALEEIRRAIQLDGAQSSFHTHLGEVYRSMRQFSEAEASCRQGVRLEPGSAGAHNTLGAVLMDQGKFEAAADSFRTAVSCQDDFVTARCNWGCALHAQGKTEEAVAAFRQAIRRKPDDAGAHHFLGMALRDLGRADEAAAEFHRALQLDPHSAAAERNLGTLLQSRSNPVEAIACFRRALAIQPDHAETHCNLGSALHELGQEVEAVRCYRRAVELQPDLAEAHFGLGMILQSQNHLAAAAECYRQAIRAKPDHAQAYSNLGTIHRAEYRLGEAIECYQKALEFRPDFAETLSNLGNVFKLQGRMTEAAICYEQSLRIKPDHALARYNRSLIVLASGDLARGWAEYESRWERGDYPKRSFAQPTWEGGPLGNRVLLVYAEQGLGDTLQFARYLQLFGGAQDQVFFEIPRTLEALFRQSGFRNLLIKDAPLPRFDVQVPLLSLPGLLGTTLENIPAAVPYLSAEPVLVDFWRRQLGARPGFNIGIAWQGSTTYPGDRYRSIALGHFAPLARPGVKLISLQIGPGSEQLAEIAGRFAVTDLGPEFDRAHGPFMDTAALMKSLDLVITSDTAIAHLAGALGIEVWLALAVSPDWRWMHDRSDSPWYPTMRLFRQTAFDDWTPVFERMADELRRRLAGRDMPGAAQS